MLYSDIFVFILIVLVKFYLDYNKLIIIFVEVRWIMIKEVRES